MTLGFASRYIVPAQVVLLALLTFYQLFQLHAPIHQLREDYDGRPILRCEDKDDEMQKSEPKQKIFSKESGQEKLQGKNIVANKISKEPTTLQKIPPNSMENSFAACLIIQGKKV